MSLLSKIFKKKAGGTLIGNLFRSVTGGITGPAPTQYDIDMKDLNDADFAKKYGTDKRGVPIEGVTPSAQQLDNQNKNKEQDKKQKWWQKDAVKWAGGILAAGLVIVLAVLGFKKRKGGKRRY